MKKLPIIVSLSIFPLFSIISQITIYESGACMETAYVLWEPLEEATSYNVYYSGESLTDIKIDSQLIRNYGGYYRADVIGLAAGEYSLKVVPVRNGSESIARSGSTTTLSVKAHVREGFAFSNNSLPGAYKADGTLKDDAQILYINNNTAKTVTLNVIIDGKGNTETITGIGNILAIKGKGYDRTPLSVRFIGKVLKENIDTIKGNKYLDLQGSKSLPEAEVNNKGPLFNVTIEGVGEDATLYGFGLNLKRTAYIEIRNLGFMLWGGGSDGDAISMDTDNLYIWVHNNDFFYGEPGSDADQVKGDGTIDMKYNSSYITISFNHFWDSGKVMGCGGATGEDNQLFITFHHNWFDHSDSRMPRLTYTNAHIYNNYYDGNGTYGIGTSRYSSAFIENNYFRGTYRPMLIPGQGTDVWEGGNDFSGGSFTSQDGGMAKAYNNFMNEGNAANDLIYFNQNTTPVTGQIDAYEVTDPAASVPVTVAAILGGYTYNNFDTDAGMYEYTAELPDNAKNTILNLAGRLNGGDFKWTFNNSVEDDNKEVIPALKDSILNYNTYYGVYTGNNDGYNNNNNGTAIETISAISQIKIYPNPISTDYFFIELNSNTYNKIEVSILNINGKQLNKWNYNDYEKILKIHHTLNKGVYIISIKTENEVLTNKLLIK